MVALRLATRGSPLAVAQARTVAEQLGNRGVETEIITISTEGDRRGDVPLATIGGKGVFVTEVQAAVLDGRADAAVHSAKDMPALATPGLHIAAFLQRADPRDVLVGSTLAGLRMGDVVATGSPRRRMQLLAVLPDITIVELRGNMATRLGQVGVVRPGYDQPVKAVVAAAAALDRLGWADRVDDVLDTADFVPQVGQGVIAVEVLSARGDLHEALAVLDDPATRRATEAERAFLARLGGDCRLPVAGYAEVLEGPTLSMTAMLGMTVGGPTPPGGQMVRANATGDVPEVLGIALADDLRALAGA